MELKLRSLIFTIVNLYVTVSFSINRHTMRVPSLSRNQFKMSTDSNSVKSMFSKSNIMKSMSILSLVSSLTFSSPAFALPGSLEDANNKLSSYNLPPILFVPPGLFI